MGAPDALSTPSGDGQAASVRRQALDDEEFDDLVRQSSLSTHAVLAIALRVPPDEVLELLRQAAVMTRIRRLRPRE